MTDADEMSDRELAALAEEVADRLERRGVVAGGAGIAAGGALGWLASGEARAGTQSAGQIGTSSNPIDAEVEDLNGADLLAASQGQAPVADGNGRLQMIQMTPSNVPGWEEDGNSPQTSTGVISDTFTLAGTFDHIKCVVQVENVGGTFIGPELQLNGDTGTNYNYRFVDGSSEAGNSGVKSFFRVPAGGASAKVWDMPGRFGGDFSFSYPADNPEQFSTFVAENTAISSPINSMTLVSPSSNSFDIRWQVYGIDNGGLP